MPFFAPRSCASSCATSRPVIDLLLGCFLLVIGPDESPGIAVSTIPELSAALMREDADGSTRRFNRIAGPGPQDADGRSFQEFMRFPSANGC